jgi:mannose-6-phosphate isomerase-like protein (cupin superfamily)
MHIARGELVQVKGSEGETVLVYPTADQPDVQSLERFQIRTLAPHASTVTEVDEERESIWMVIRGSGTVHRGDGSAALGEKDLLIFAGGEPHSFEASGDGLEFFDVAWTSKVLSVEEIKEALESAEGVGEPYEIGAGHWERDSIPLPEERSNYHIQGTVMPEQAGDTCYRFPTDRGHSSLDHWDQNSTLPTWRAADHSHISNEEVRPRRCARLLLPSQTGVGPQAASLLPSASASRAVLPSRGASRSRRARTGCRGVGVCGRHSFGTSLRVRATSSTAAARVCPARPSPSDLARSSATRSVSTTRSLPRTPRSQSSGIASR